MTPPLQCSLSVRVELGVELSPQGNIAVAVTFQLPDVALQLAQLFTHCPLLQGRIIFPVAHVETSAANFHPEDSVAVQQDAELRQDAGAPPADDPAADESTVPLGCAAVRLAAAAKAPHPTLIQARIRQQHMHANAQPAA